MKPAARKMREANRLYLWQWTHRRMPRGLKWGDVLDEAFPPRPMGWRRTRPRA